MKTKPDKKKTIRPRIQHFCFFCDSLMRRKARIGGFHASITPMGAPPSARVPALRFAPAAAALIYGARRTDRSMHHGMESLSLCS